MSPIVIVDDSSEDLLFAQRIVKECKILNPVVLLKSGLECLEHFQNVGIDGAPGLVLVDLVMPHPNGVEVIRQLCHSPVGVHSIFVMLSGLADMKLIQQGYQQGARTFLVKPLIKEDFLRLLDAMKGVKISTERDGCVLSFDPGERLERQRRLLAGDTDSISLSS
ncbi:MAG: response regulator [Limisphaerales bacterium]